MMLNNKLLGGYYLARNVAVATRILAVALFVIATNSGFEHRISVILEQGRWPAAIGFTCVWGLCFAALLIAAFQPKLWVRAAWAVLIALSTAIGFAFHEVGGSDLGVLDALSLWSARHEAGRALDFYSSEVWRPVVVLVIGILILAVPPVPTNRTIKRWLGHLGWTPLIPVVCIAAIIYLREGGGAQSLPTQFTPLSVATVSGLALAKSSVPERAVVTWQPAAPKVRNIVFILDESVRADYIDWSPGNPYTPELASLKSRIIDFSPAASGGVCSSYSNSILRFGASRSGLGRQLLLNPTIWDYAKSAGFRAVFIDAQAAVNRNPGKLQNFMSPDEALKIDHFHVLPSDLPPHALDDKLLDLVVEELKSDKPVFIYAVKNGAHFPYDRGYPGSERFFGPTMSEVGHDGIDSRIRSYRNVVKWTVDRFFKRLFAEIDLTKTVVLYTSDHGEQFDPRRMPHCTIEAPDPRVAFVPLFAITDEIELRARFDAAARESHGHGSHFTLVPSILQLMGYSPADVRQRYGESLLEPNKLPPFFTTGDIFNLFSATVRKHSIDLEQTYLETEARVQPTRAAKISDKTGMSDPYASKVDHVRATTYDTGVSKP
jgi:glucan phosphoethanolaminetransferase (alkaline phosphatase superfamily)